MPYSIAPGQARWRAFFPMAKNVCKLQTGRKTCCQPDCLILDRSYIKSSSDILHWCVLPHIGNNYPANLQNQASKLENCAGKQPQGKGKRYANLQPEFDKQPRGRRPRRFATACPQQTGSKLFSVTELTQHTILLPHVIVQQNFPILSSCS